MTPEKRKNKVMEFWNAVSHTGNVTGQNPYLHRVLWDRKMPLNRSGWNATNVRIQATRETIRMARMEPSSWTYAKKIKTNETQCIQSTAVSKTNSAIKSFLQHAIN